MEETMRSFKFTIMLLIISILLTLMGCGTTGTICQNVPTGQTSVICTLSTKLNTSPEAISQILQIANVAALDKSLYTAQQADAFLDGVITDLKQIKSNGQSISYVQAIDYLNKKYAILPKEVQAAMIIMNPASLSTQEIKLPLCEYDIDLLISHCKKQLQIVQIFTK
jgi:hypothetical protein